MGATEIILIVSYLFLFSKTKKHWPSFNVNMRYWAKYECEWMDLKLFFSAKMLLQQIIGFDLLVSKSFLFWNASKLMSPQFYIMQVHT